MYKSKYFKYRNKYVNLKNQCGGMELFKEGLSQGIQPTNLLSEPEVEILRGKFQETDESQYITYLQQYYRDYKLTEVVEITADEKIPNVRTSFNIFKKYIAWKEWECKISFTLEIWDDKRRINTKEVLHTANVHNNDLEKFKEEIDKKLNEPIIWDKDPLLDYKTSIKKLVIDSGGEDNKITAISDSGGPSYNIMITNRNPTIKALMTYIFGQYQLESSLEDIILPPTEWWEDRRNIDNSRDDLPPDERRTEGLSKEDKDQLEKIKGILSDSV